MPNEWQRVNVGELLNRGALFIGDGYRAKNVEFGPTGLPFARVGNIGADGELDLSGADLFPEKDLHKVGNKISLTNDIAFTSKGTVGRFIFVKEGTPRFVYSPQVSFWRVINRAEIEPRFLIFWMRSREFIEQVHGLKGQTDMADYVSLNDQRRMTITLPPLPIQRRIVEILGRLDDKIEVNRRINRTLERMVQALYKHWFVDFGPFQDGEFVESAVGLAPKGWEVGVLGDIARNDKDLVDPRGIDPRTPYIGLGDMPQGSITLDTWGVAGDSISTKCKMKQGQILFGKLRPYFKKVGIAPVEGVCSTDILVVAPRQDEYHSLVLCQLIQQDFIDHTEAVSDGTRMPRVSWEMMAKYPMLIPDRATVLRFSEIVWPWLEIITHSVIENRSLAAARDYLLPRLLAGEVI